MLSKATTSHDTTRGWLKRLGRGLDGVVAKRLDLPYRPGERAMQKYKLWKTVDCVVGGIYYKRGTQSVEYLLMGLYDDAGLLNYVGRCGIGENGQDRQAAEAADRRLRVHRQRARWHEPMVGRERKPVPLEPKLVAEVSADHIENGRFRHGSRLIRWRDDKEPRACTLDQLTRL